MTSMNVVLPDVLIDAPRIGGDVLVAEIAEDFSVVPPQSTTLPLGSASKRPGEGRRRCFPNSWKCLDNSGSHSIARIVLGWDPSILGVLLMFYSDQLLCVRVTCLDTQRVCYISAVYGANALLDRRELWASMRALSSAIGHSP
ncbi:hypothetical protein RHGRI_034254 [Rhododendron griersonianum]|uniref:Uncharacterized protein n=1 Tax=Rhododendron griersonianum TaxID=479676 RepID=A0AAV6HZT8_9ERIC|nr:hypothetical protein RHGRI_034254 [Rhododendron griersonianum]